MSSVDLFETSKILGLVKSVGLGTGPGYFFEFLIGLRPRWKSSKQGTYCDYQQEWRPSFKALLIPYTGQIYTEMTNPSPELFFLSGHSLIYIIPIAKGGKNVYWRLYSTAPGDSQQCSRRICERIIGCNLWKVFLRAVAEEGSSASQSLMLAELNCSFCTCACFSAGHHHCCCSAAHTFRIKAQKDVGIKLALLEQDAGKKARTFVWIIKS